jgi:hypothetical protein
MGFLLVITMLVVVFVEGYRMGRTDVGDAPEGVRLPVPEPAHGRAHKARGFAADEPMASTEAGERQEESIAALPEIPAPPASMPAAGPSSPRVKNPKPYFIGTPYPLPPNVFDPQKHPWGLTLPPDAQNEAYGKPVTSSDSEPLLGDLTLVTDGLKDCAEGSYVELQSGVQWVQIDLLRETRIDAIGMWHFCLSPRTYKDVQVWVSSDPEFQSAIEVFNNDGDGSLGAGVGTHVVYLETHLGLLQAVGSITGRFVRAYSSGSTANGLNHYIEIEVYGRAL